MPVNYELNDVTNKSYVALMNTLAIELPGAPADSTVFQSTSQPFAPMRTIGNVFGGHVLGQSVVAAAQTVANGLVCHSMSSYFLRPGLQDLPFIYLVERIREGRVYANRSVKVYQVEESDLDAFRFDNKYLRFTALLSFKAPEDSPLDFQARSNPEFDIPDHEIIQMEMAPDVDTPMLLEILRVNGMEAQWHPIDCRRMDTTAYNKGKATQDRRMVHYFRSFYDFPNDDPNIHVSLLLYMSDRNSLFTLTNIWENPHVYINRLASLSHTFVLHNLDVVTDADYLTMEGWTTRAFDSRGIYEGRIYDRSDRMVASFIQDGMVDVTPYRL